MNFTFFDMGYPQLRRRSSRTQRVLEQKRAALTIDSRARSNTALFQGPGSDGDEADVSTLEDAARAPSWVSGAQPHERRARGIAQPPRARSQAARAVASAGKRFGLDAARRLRDKAYFERLLRRGRRRTLEGYTFFIERRAAGGARLGIVISRKHAALATERNDLKRCIREAFRLEQETLGPMDLLIRPPYGAKASARMLSQLRVLLKSLATSS
jgi:ribonuclease P protein component